jgi:hypothetical protein
MKKSYTKQKKQFHPEPGDYRLSAGEIKLPVGEMVKFFSQLYFKLITIPQETHCFINASLFLSSMACFGKLSMTTNNGENNDY